MIGFWSIAAAMTMAALLCVLMPLLRRADDTPQVRPRALIVSIFRRELADVDRDFLAGRVSKEQHAAAREDIERRVLADTAHTVVPTRDTAFARIAPCALLVPLLPALACMLYLKIGEPAALTLNDPPDVFHDMQAGSVEMMVARLAYRLNGRAPEQRDATDWTTLARSYSVLDRPADATAAYAKAVALDPSDAPLRADYADALATANEGRLDGRATQQIAAALAIDEANPKALALAASAAFDAHAYARAIGYWRRLDATLANDSPVAIQARKNIDDAIRRSAVTVDLRLADTAALPPDAVIVVTARAKGGSNEEGNVLAEKRVPGALLPTQIVLDDALAQNAGDVLSGAPDVVIDTRIEAPGAIGPTGFTPVDVTRKVEIVIANPNG